MTRTCGRGSSRAVGPVPGSPHPDARLSGLPLGLPDRREPRWTPHQPSPLPDRSLSGRRLLAAAGTSGLVRRLRATCPPPPDCCHSPEGRSGEQDQGQAHVILPNGGGSACPWLANHVAALIGTEPSLPVPEKEVPD